MAFSKTCGRSKDPGGAWCLLGLPWGVCCGLMKASCEGVLGRFMSSAPERVCIGGGGVGSWKVCLSAAMTRRGWLSIWWRAPLGSSCCCNKWQERSNAGPACEQNALALPWSNYASEEQIRSSNDRLRNTRRSDTDFVAVDCGVFTCAKTSPSNQWHARSLRHSISSFCACSLRSRCVELTP
jgi:hypothetical protein